MGNLNTTLQVTKYFLKNKLQEACNQYNNSDILYYRKKDQLERLEKECISLKNTVESIDASRKEHELDMKNYQNMLNEIEESESKQDV
jgi:septal ring factor EnvC (AmiA/AmiB activator)